MSQPITSVQQHLLDLVNARLQTALTASQVDFTPVVMLDASVLDFTVPGKRNSKTQIATKAGAEPSVDLEVTYNRLQLQKLFSLRSKQFEDAGETTTHQLLAKLSARAGITLTADDIIDEAISRTGDAPYAVTLKSQPTSYQIFGDLALTVGEGSTGPVDPEPEAGTGFFMSNMAARALTSDFATYQAIPDELAPVFGANYTWAKDEAAIGDKAGRLWAFIRNDENWTKMHRSTTGGQTWTMDMLRNDEGTQPAYPDWRFTGRMLAYFKGCVYGYFIHRMTGIVWVCRLREEDETGSVFDLQPIIAMPSVYLPAIAADAESIALTSREPDPDRLSYEATTYLHFSTDADQWNKRRLYHPWSSNEGVMPLPEIMVHALVVKDNIIAGVGQAQWVDLERTGKMREVYFEINMNDDDQVKPYVVPLEMWPNWRDDFPNAADGPWASEFKSMAVVGDKVLIYMDNVYINDPDAGMVSRDGILLTRIPGSFGDTTVVLENSGISQGRIYDNGERVVISGKRSGPGQAGEFLAYTDDRTGLTNWQYGTGTEELFQEVDTSQYVTYVSATRSGEVDEVFIPQLTPINDPRYALPSPKDNIGTDTEVASNVTVAGMQSTGKAIIGGTFGWVQGQAARRYMLRLKETRGNVGDPEVALAAIDTSFLAPFSVSQTTVNDMSALVVCEDDSIVFAGSISQVGGVQFYGIGRTTAAGGVPTVWPTVELRDQYNSRTISNVKLFKTPDEKIFLVAEGLRKVGANDSYYIAKFNADGTPDGGFSSPFNPGGPLVGNQYRSAVMLPNGDLLVNQGSTNNYQTLLIKADGTVPAAGAQPFKANSNQEIYAAFACPYTNGYLIFSGNAMLADGTELNSISRLTAGFELDSDWVGRVGSENPNSWYDNALKDIIPLSDGTGFMVAKQSAYWYDSNGVWYGHDRNVFVVDQNGNLDQTRLPLYVSDVHTLLADPANTGDAATDSYLIVGRFARTFIGDYPRSTISFNQNYVRTRVLPAPAPPQQ